MYPPFPLDNFGCQQLRVCLKYSIGKGLAQQHCSGEGGVEAYIYEFI